MPTSQSHEKFTSKFGFLMAAIGAAVGLGNLWKFPYLLGENGGGAFMLIYLLFMLLIATPLIMAEMVIGRHGQLSAPSTMKKLANEIGASPFWQSLGWLGLVAQFFVLSFFSVIGGWSLAYMLKIGSGSLSGLNPAEVGAQFGAFLADPWSLTLFHTIFMASTVFVVARGIRSGIEKAVKVMMPLLFLMLIGFVIYGVLEGDFSQATHFMFSVDFNKITPEVALAAVGQAFFSVNVGMGAVLTYAAYLPKDVNIPRASIIIVIGDTAFALLAGLAIFPIVYAYGLNPQAGPGLVFITLTTAFAQMTGGQIVGGLFFFLVFVAALTSALSMLEVMVSRAEEVPGRTRKGMSVLLGTTILLTGLGTVFSFNIGKEFYPLDFIPVFADKHIFGIIDYIITHIMLPIGAMGYALFAGWWMSSKTMMNMLKFKQKWQFTLWLWLTRLVAPLAILSVFFFNLF